MTDIVTIAAITSAWKLLGSLYAIYNSWTVRKKKSKAAVEKKTRAEALMASINQAILTGSSSDDPEVTALVRDFRALLAEDVKPDGHEVTESWIVRSRNTKYTSATAKKAAPAKRPAAKKPVAKKAAAKRPIARKAAAKKL